MKEIQEDSNKSSKRTTAGRKKKAQRKASSKAIKKKSPEKKTAPVMAEKRTNKHRSYIKVKLDEETGACDLGSSDGEDLFYMGTYDAHLTTNIVNQVLRICSSGKKDSELITLTTNASMAAILEIDPQDATELMLATQMVTVHNLTMEMSRRALLTEDQTHETINFNVNWMTKLMRTYMAQMEALNKYRNKGKQQITVQHVNVNDGGQAVIGDVNQGGGNG